MSRWRVPVVGVLVWLAVVAVGSTAVWWVIGSVGEDLGPGRSVSEVVPDVEPGRGSGGPSGPSSSASPAPPSAPRGSGSSSPSGSPSASGSPSPRATGSPGAAPVVVHQQTWSGRGGYVTVRCRGAQAGLVAAQPDPGYAVDVSDRGPDRVEVSFEGRTEDGGRHVEVRADCVGGRPSYQLSTSGGGRDE